MATQPQHRTLRSWVYNTLRERIIAGDLAPGEAIVEARLAEELGVSRSPIREALRQLGQEGFVLTLQNSATKVTTFDAADMDQIFEVRDLLESSLVAHAAITRTDDELQAGRTLLEQMSQFATNGDIPNFAKLDVEFHSLLWRMAERPRVMQTLLPVADHARRYMNVTSRERQYETSVTMLASCEEHEQILSAISNRAVARAVAAGRAHMRSSRLRILEGVSQASSAQEPVLDEPSRSVYTLTWNGVEE